MKCLSSLPWSVPVQLSDESPRWRRRRSGTWCEAGRSREYKMPNGSPAHLRTPGAGCSGGCWPSAKHACRAGTGAGSRSRHPERRTRPQLRHYTPEFMGSAVVIRIRAPKENPAAGASKTNPSDPLWFGAFSAMSSELANWTCTCDHGNRSFRHCCLRVRSPRSPTFFLGEHKYSDAPRATEAEACGESEIAVRGR